MAVTFILRVERLDSDEAMPVCVFPAGSTLIEAHAAALTYLDAREALGFTYAPVQARTWYAWGCVNYNSVYLEVRILADAEPVN